MDSWARNVRRGLFSVAKKHRYDFFDVFFRCDTTKHRKLSNLTDIVFVRQDAKKKRQRSTMALDRRCFFQVTETPPAF